MSEEKKEDKRVENDKKMKALEGFFNSLLEYPEYIAKMAELFGKVLEPWEAFGGSGLINTEFKKKTVNGKVVASIKRDYPTWKVEIEGRVVPKVHQEIGIRNKPEEICKFADGLLEEKGYILIKSEDK